MRCGLPVLRPPPPCAARAVQEHKYTYSIIGHSGDSHKIPFVLPGECTASVDLLPKDQVPEITTSHPLVRVLY